MRCYPTISTDVIKSKFSANIIPANIYMFKINDGVK